MSLKEQARAWMKQVAANHVGKNIRSFRWTTYTGGADHNQLGGISYLSPIEGTVVDANDTFTLVKVKPSFFCVIRSALLSCPVEVGSRIAAQFYQLRRFDGTAADGSEDAREGGGTTIMLTGAKTWFPVKWEDRYLGINERFAGSYREIRNPYLRDLITQMEEMPVNGGLRRVVNVLVDANATDLDFEDPAEEDSADKPPAIRARVSTGQFAGMVEIYYDRASDTYGILLSPAGGNQPQEHIEDVHFDELGNVLIRLIDDGAWQQAKVTVLKKARNSVAAAAA